MFSPWMDGFADCPSWWVNRGVVNTNASVVANDYAAANQGQLKWFARNAMLEMNACLPDGAGSNVIKMVSAFSSTNNYLPINIGQLKCVVSLFYERLIRAGVTNAYPWSATAADDADYAIANLGQLKNMFSFVFPDFYSGEDSDGDGMPDVWEMYCFGSLSHTANEDTDHDGLYNLAEFWQHTDPNAPDTDGDGLSDGLESNFGARLVCWGRNDFGQTNPPLGELDGVVAVSAGYDHCLAVKNDGHVVSWGRNDCGQTNVPANLTGVVAVAAGAQFSMALTEDGRVICWGINTSGETSVPPGLTGVVAIAAGEFHGMALKSDGRVVSWGLYDQTSVPADLTGVVAINTGYLCSMALKKDGHVVCWGSLDGCVSCAAPDNATGVVAIATGCGHCMALRKDGSVVCWGSGVAGETSVPVNLTGVVAIAAGAQHSMALKSDGTIVGWGDNSYSAATAPSSLTGAIAIDCGFQYSVALVSSGGLNPRSEDTDGDGMPDLWERNAGLDPSDASDAVLDPDLDGLTNLQEYQFGSLCFCDDTDADGLSDGLEYILGTNPRLRDTDGDGVSDYEEFVGGSNPTNLNSVPCAISGKVLYSGTQCGPIYVCATNSLARLNRVTVITSPGEYDIANLVTLSSYGVGAFCDVNGNGVRDFWEPFGTCSGAPLILSGDTNGVDVAMTDPDTDGDGLPDWWEMQIVNADANDAITGVLEVLPGDDFDGDGVCNRDEYVRGTSPTDRTSTVKSISGTISYAGPQSGPIFVSVNSQSGVWDSALKTVIAVPGSFSVTNVPTLVGYWVEAYRDSNGNGTNDAWEASGCFSTNKICLSDDLTGLAIVLSDPDADGDGLPDWWEMQIVNSDPNDNLITVQDVCPGDDFDGDGVCNRDEYIRGTSPTDRLSLPPVLEFSDAEMVVDESNRTLAISLRLYPPASGTVVAHVSVVNSTATNGVDYLFSDTDVVFMAGQINGACSVTVCRQAEAQPDKHVVFGVNLQSGAAVLGAKTRHVLTITGDADGTGGDPAPDWVPDTEDTLKFRLLTPSNNMP